jgi:hypoxanthine phosphoribosyltransferase
MSRGYLDRLGFEARQAVVVVHVDDVGLSSAANMGGLRALEGAATCASVMVPAPGFEQIAAIARQRSDLDLGVHLTLNAEHEGWRWRPLRDDVSSLVDAGGEMWRTTEETVAHAHPDEVRRELRAQIERALDAGIDVTHIDSHMGTVLHARFVEIYVELALEYRLPAFVPQVDLERLPPKLRTGSIQRYVELIAHVERAGFPVFDHFESNSLHFEPGRGLEHNRARLDRLGPGLSYLITHCAEGGPELASITRDWRQRDEEHRLYSDGTMTRELEARGFATIGMRPLRELLREGAGAMPRLREIVSADEVRGRIDRLADEVCVRSGTAPLQLVVIEEGARRFAEALARGIRARGTPVELVSVRARRSEGRELRDVRIDPIDPRVFAGSDVVIVDDIADEGRTLEAVERIVCEGGPRSVRTAVLVSKPSRRQVALRLDLVGFEVEDGWVVGFGMDLDGAYRELDGLAVIEPG